MRASIVGFLVVLLVACGGGSDSPPETGTVTIAITDASIHDYDEALLEVSSITLIGSGGQETNVLDSPQTIDLLKLRNVSELLLRETLTVRTISKIRLGVESITLNKLDMEGNVVESDRPAVPTSKIDLNPQGSLAIRAGEDLMVMIDVDLHNSVKVHRTGNGAVKFRPLVKVAAGVSGLVRLYGTYTEDAGETSICDLERVSDADGDYDVLDMCVALDLGSATYFGQDGLPLDGSLATGDKVSVYGYYVQTASGDVLNVQIVARGAAMRGEAFTTLEGIAASDWDAGLRRFDLDLTETEAIPVELSDGGKVFDADGELLEPTEIVMGKRTEARGALTDWLQAFIVFVTGDDSNDTTSGEVLETDGTLLILKQPVDVDCVITNASTEFFEIETDGDVSSTSEILLNKIVPGDRIEASGDQVGDCIQATTVIKEVEPSS